MNIKDELKQSFDPLDATKTWPEDKFPLMPVGLMVLDRNPENYFAEVEQAAFSPSNMVPGVEPSADKLLQGRVFAYADTQRYRLGPNYLELPVNKPKSGVNNNQLDGPMQDQIYDKGTVNYEPNTLLKGVPHEAPPVKDDRIYPVGPVTRQKISLTNDFQQAGERYLSLSKTDRDHLVDNIVDSLSHAEKSIQKRMADNLTKANTGTWKPCGKRIKARITSKTPFPFFIYRNVPSSTL